MTSSQKTAVSLLISVILFGAFSVLAYTGLFSVIDARFYEPEKIEQIQNHLDIVSKHYNEYIETLEKRFGIGEQSFLNQKSVLTYIENSPSEENVRSRSKLSGDLFSETPGLLGMRLIDKNGKNVHFSTFSTDVLSRKENLVSYKNYSEVLTLSGQSEIDFEKISSPDSYSSKGKVCKTVFDGKENRIIFSFPFYDSYMAYRGSFIFYVNANDFNRVLIAKKIITFSETGNLISDLNSKEDADFQSISEYKSGFVFGLPRVGKDIFEKEILARWQKGLLSPEKIVFKEDQNIFDTEEKTYSIFDRKKKESYWVLVSSAETKFGYIGGIYSDDIFVMSDGIKILLLVCIFVTLFLLTFLLINLKQDEMIVIRGRIRKLQLGIINEYLKNKEDVNWKLVSGKIAERKNDVSLEIIKSLGRKGKKHSKEVNEMINRCWDELLAAMNYQSRQENTESAFSNSEEIKKMLQEILSSGSIKVQAIAGQPSGVQAVQPVAVTQVSARSEAEDLSDAETLDEVESIDEVEALDDAETLDEVESIDEVEELNDAETLDEVESIDEVEEVSDVNSINVSSKENNGYEEISLDDFEEVEDFLTEDSEVNHKNISEAESIIDVERLNKEVSSVNRLVTDEDNLIIDNFSISKLDYSDLDNDLETKTEKKEDTIEEVSLDDFEISFNQEDENSELKEDVGFASFENVNKTVDKEDVVFDVEPEVLNFSMLDKKVEIKYPKKKKKSLDKENEYSIRKIQQEVQETSLEGQQEIIELKDSNVGIPFSLTTFGASSQNPVELTEYADVIQEDDSGVFVINSTGLEIEPQDLKFKTLVDSVLKN